MTRELVGRQGSNPMFAGQIDIRHTSVARAQRASEGLLTENTAYDSPDAAQGAREEYWVKAVT